MNNEQRHREQLNYKILSEYKELAEHQSSLLTTKDERIKELEAKVARQKAEYERAEKATWDLILEHQKQVEAEADLSCPFCNEKGFDKAGLKNHLIMYCDDYLITETL